MELIVRTPQIIVMKFGGSMKLRPKVRRTIIIEILNNVTKLTEVRVCFQAVVIYKSSHRCFVMTFFSFRSKGDKPFLVLISSPRSFSYESQSSGNRAFKKVKSSVELTLKVSGQLQHCAPSNGVIIITMMGK